MVYENITDALHDCNDIKDCIMEKIKNTLEEKKINISINSDSEVIAKKTTKKKIKNILSKVDYATESQIKLLLQITEINGDIFIRQKFK